MSGVAAGSGVPGRPGPNTPAADPAPLSDSESDAFARIGSAVVRAGKVEARLGRAFKSVSPRLTMKAYLDLASIVNPSVILKVSINEKGNITDVEVLKSSGSNEVDLPTRLALYKWWIEPRKDKKSGQPAADVIPVVFSFR